MGYDNHKLRDIYDKNSGYCWHCGKKIALTNYGKQGAKGCWEVDHSNPKSKGGTDFFRNLVPSCIPCNRQKSERHSRSFTPPNGYRESSGDGCFIATAAYGTPFAVSLDLLRGFRDQVLKQKSMGNHFVQVYYWLSPPIADMISRCNAVRAFIRMILRPFVYALETSNSFSITSNHSIKSIAQSAEQEVNYDAVLCEEFKNT